MNLFARFVGIVTAPRATYQNVVAHPRWLGMFLLARVIVAAGAALPLTTDAARQSLVDKQARAMEAWTGSPANDQQYEVLQRQAAFAPYTTALGAFVGGGIIGVIFAGILFAVFNAAMGGEASFKQVFAVVVHASVISALSQLFAGPLNYFRGSVDSPTTLAALLPMLEDDTFAGRLAGAIDIFMIWWVLVLSIGLAVLYRRRTQPIAATLLGVYALIAVGIAAFMSR